MIERRYGVWLSQTRVGWLDQRGDHTWFTLADEYLTDPHRAVLGLVFEDNPTVLHSSHMRLPPWFSNLLPEGRLREWIALDRHVSPDREMELLAQVGADLPGAVRILDEGGTPGPLTGTGIKIDANAVDLKADPGTWRFSLAGVGLKFSMLKTGDRLTLPAYGQGGDWIVKLPDPYHQDVPRNEHAMMELASHAGIEVPEHALVPRNTLANLPGNAWQGQEEFAYAVRRFDRGQGRTLIHIEDFAQVKNVYPYYDGKYEGNFETVANYIYRSRDLNALREFARRLTFNILIHNSDAHLKNWSLIYKDQRIPTLSPAYDLVSTGFYGIGSESDDLGLKFGGKRIARRIRLSNFERVEERLGAHGANLRDVVVETIERVNAAWPTVAAILNPNVPLQQFIDSSITARSQSLLGLPVGETGVR